MKRFAAFDLRTKIRDMFKAAAKEPVQITADGRETFVLMTDERFRRFEALEDALWAARALKASKNGFLGTENAEALLQELIASISA